MSAAGSAAARRIGVLASVIEEARRRARKRRRAYGALLIAALAGVGLYAVLGGGDAPGGDGGGDSTKLGSNPEPTQVLRSIEAPPGEVRWTLVGMGPCYELVVEEIGGGDRGGLSGSCATKRPLSYSPGGIEVGGRWYNVIDGRAGAKASEVRVSLADGTTRTERIVDGVWLVVVPGPDPVKENSFDVKRIETLDRAGAVLASARPASIKALYEQITRVNRAPTHVNG